MHGKIPYEVDAVQTITILSILWNVYNLMTVSLNLVIVSQSFIRQIFVV